MNSGPDEVGLGTYTITLRLRGDESPVHDFDGEGANLLDWLYAQVNATQWSKGVMDSRTRFAVQQVRRVADHTVYGVLQVGHVGQSSDICDGELGSRVMKKEIKHADIYPYYFQVYAPRGSALAVVVLQKTLGKSPFPYFDDVLHRAFRDTFPTVTYELRPHVARAVLQKMSEGRLREIRITQKKDQHDLAKQVLGAGYRENDITVETRIVAKKGKFLPEHGHVRAIVRGLRRGTAIKQPAALAELGDKITFSVQVGRNTRSFSYGSNREIFPYVDVTSKLQYDSDLHPKLASINREADDLVSDVAVELGIAT